MKMYNLTIGWKGVWLGKLGQEYFVQAIFVLSANYLVIYMPVYM